MTRQKAKKIYNYLLEKSMGFCFLEDGTFVSREGLLKIINSK